MASRNAETLKQLDETITRGTGNVFADLGYADADERQTKLRLAHAINSVSVLKNSSPSRLGARICCAAVRAMGMDLGVCISVE